MQSSTFNFSCALGAALSSGRLDTIADLDAVLRIFLSLTRIAQIETQARRGAFRTVNLVEIAGEVVELYDAAAEQVGTRLTVIGDGAALFAGSHV